MPDNGPTQPQPVDYYSALGLQPSAPSHVLVDQLTQRIAQMPPGPERHFAEQARAILGDPGRRAIYDARLRDPQAPTWTPAELHRLALAPSAPPRGVSAVPRPLQAAIAAGLVALIALVVVIAWPSGGSTDTDTAAAEGSAGSSSVAAAPGANNNAAAGSCEIASNEDLAKISTSNKRSKNHTVVLTDAYPLPAMIAGSIRSGDDEIEADGYPVAALPGGGAMVQFRDSTGDFKLAYDISYTPDGIMSMETTQTVYGENTSTPISQHRPHSEYSIDTYTRIDTNGHTVPEKAIGKKATGNLSTLAVLADEADTSVVWVLLPEGEALYKGAVVKVTGDADPASCL